MRYCLVVDIGASSGRHILGHLENGIYSAGRDMDETFDLIETVEKAAELYMLIAHLPHVNTIHDDELKAVADAFELDYRKDFLNM